MVESKRVTPFNQNGVSERYPFKPNGEEVMDPFGRNLE